MSNLSPKQSKILAHFAYVLVVAVGGVLLAFLASPAFADLVSKNVALIAAPLLVALVSSVVQWAKSNE